MFLIKFGSNLGKKGNKVKKVIDRLIESFPPLPTEELVNKETDKSLKFMGFLFKEKKTLELLVYFGLN